MSLTSLVQSIRRPCSGIPPQRKKPRLRGDPAGGLEFARALSGCGTVHSNWRLCRTEQTGTTSSSSTILGNARIFRHVLKEKKESVAVYIGEEYILLRVSAHDDVVEGSGDMKSRLAWHVLTLPTSSYFAS